MIYNTTSKDNVRRADSFFAKNRRVGHIKGFGRRNSSSKTAAMPDKRKTSPSMAEKREKHYHFQKFITIDERRIKTTANGDSKPSP